ncbi:MAG: DeoR/GlpR family DNA-binding transcription regulator [Actinomycetota bacterium]|nr:DeoR/GlpR family DNA-binding transcription regulator [Actinomycetota bacterium]
MRYSQAPVRRAEILRELSAEGHVSVNRLSGRWAVSEMTIRRDLHELAGQGLLRLVRGGARPHRPQDRGLPFPHRTRSNLAAKRAIAVYAAGHLHPEATIALDSGTTVVELARSIPANLPLTVITHSLAAMAILAGRPEIRLIGLGGVYNERTRSFGGPDTRRALRGLRADVLFLAASAVNRDGIACATPWDADTKRALLDVAVRVVVPADATKFRAAAPVAICGLDRVDVLITDADVTSDPRPGFPVVQRAVVQR